MAQKKGRPLVFLTGENLLQYKFIHAQCMTNSTPAPVYPVSRPWKAVFAFHGQDTGDTGAGIHFVIHCASINLYCSKFSPVKKTKGLSFFWAIL